MASVNVQSDSSKMNSTEISPASTPLSQLATVPNAPKIWTLIPNRIFVGGIPSNTTEQELKTYFSTFGQVKDAKIVNDRSGLSKGSYGFVTFESQDVAESIIKNESETLIFKDRKLNIGHAIRKQQLLPRAEIPNTVFFTNGAVPYTFQNGMAVFHMPGQEYPLLQQASSYAAMMLPPPAVYLPQPQYAAYQTVPTAAATALPASALTNPGTPQQVLNVPTAAAQWSAISVPAQPPVTISNRVGAGAATGATTGSNGGGISVSSAAGSSTPTGAAGSGQWRWQLPSSPQSPPTAAVAPATYFYSPIATGTGHELMYIHQAGTFTPNSTSDYSTDHSANMLEAMEYDGSPGRNSGCGQQPTSSGSTPTSFPTDFCLSPYGGGGVGGTPSPHQQHLVAAAYAAAAAAAQGHQSQQHHHHLYATAASSTVAKAAAAQAPPGLLSQALYGAQMMTASGSPAPYLKAAHMPQYTITRVFPAVGPAGAQPMPLFAPAAPHKMMMSSTMSADGGICERMAGNGKSYSAAGAAYVELVPGAAVTPPTH